MGTHVVHCGIHVPASHRTRACAADSNGYCDLSFVSEIVISGLIIGEQRAGERGAFIKWKIMLPQQPIDQHETVVAIVVRAVK